jgi:uncharacterized protein (TIGR02646 family)
MLKLSISSLSATTLRHLAHKQTAIDSLVVDKRASKAQTLWDSKGKPTNGPGAVAFDEVKKTLISMCVSTELCNYCEHNEATDIEHIYPKSFFPERTFQWSNYLLACKTCNTHYKLDKFSVFTSTQQLPPSSDAAFIDPRVEDPMKYLFLNIKDSSFIFVPHPDLIDPRDIAKAERTLAVLQIGARAALVEARKKAFKFYQERLERYKKVLDATTWGQLEQLVQDPDLVDKSDTFENARKIMLDSIKRSIIEYFHPTVWREMQRQYLHLNKTKILFEDVNEALNWM